MANQNTYIAFLRDWGASDDIIGTAGSDTTFDPDNMKTLALHEFGRDTGASKGAIAQGFRVSFNNTDTDIAGVVFIGYNVSAATADAPRIDIAWYSDDPPTAPNRLGLTGGLPCRYRDDWGLGYEPTSGRRELSWFFGLDGASDATSSADDYYSGTPPTFSGTPSVLTCRSLQIIFRAVASPDGYWQGSIIGILEDALVVLPIANGVGTLDPKSISDAPILDVYDGAGQRFTLQWFPLNLTNAQKFIAAHVRAGDGPFFLVPDDRVTHSSGGAINGDFTHFAGGSPVRRGGLVRFVGAPEIEAVPAKDSAGSWLYRVTATFETWGVGQ